MTTNEPNRPEQEPSTQTQSLKSTEDTPKNSGTNSRDHSLKISGRREQTKRQQREAARLKPSNSLAFYSSFMTNEDYDMAREMGLL